MQAYLATFLPLFVAINVAGILPLFLSLTEGMSTPARRRLSIEALATALILAIVILFAGQLIFRVMGITINDLRVGGGLILLVLSITDLIFGDLRRRDPGLVEHAPGDIGVVPLGTPLVVGPAAITTILVSQQGYGYLPTLASLVVNLMLVLLIFWYGPTLIGFTGPSASKAIGKVASLFLAAIAVAMIRAGLVAMLAAH